MLFTGYPEISWMARDTLTECRNYECAHSRLTQTHIVSLGYLILAGTKSDEGAVVIRSNFKVEHEDRLDTNNGTWFLVQTNEDEWSEGCYNRCAAATARLNEIGQENINHTRLLNDVLLKFPTLNYDTLYHTSMTPSSGYIET